MGAVTFRAAEILTKERKSRLLIKIPIVKIPLILFGADFPVNSGGAGVFLLAGRLRPHINAVSLPPGSICFPSLPQSLSKSSDRRRSLF
jgi:hypothetical protein